MDTHAIAAEIANQDKRLYEAFARQEQARATIKQCRAEISEARAIIAALRFAAQKASNDAAERGEQDSATTPPA